ncbi:hypothetical protein [Gimesia alba]|uniref:hypothetical protein n=1 Tax=Gimesia alba TaxID=2527973 RepID=UPI0011A76441|nr:hypothetical protein [Gimesia alba]
MAADPPQSWRSVCVVYVVMHQPPPTYTLTMMCCLASWSMFFVGIDNLDRETSSAPYSALCRVKPNSLITMSAKPLTPLQICGRFPSGEP